MTCDHVAAQCARAAAFVAAGLAASAQSAPITLNTALPVAEGEFVFRQQLIVARARDDPSAADRDFRADSVVSVLGYGVDRKLAVFAVLPYREKELRATDAGERPTRNSSAFGDISAFARFTAYQRDGRGRTTRLAPFAGLEAPTAPDDDRDVGGRLPPPVQPGSGAWDVFGGLVTTHQTLAYQLDGQVSYRVHGEANQLKVGDTARLDGSLQYRIAPSTLEAGTPAFVYAVLEASLIHQRRNDVDGAQDPDSGGSTVLLSPGLQYVSRRWIAEAAVEVPVQQELNGEALEQEYVARVGFRVNF